MAIDADKWRKCHEFEFMMVCLSKFISYGKGKQPLKMMCLLASFLVRAETHVNLVHLLLCLIYRGMYEAVTGINTTVTKTVTMTSPFVLLNVPGTSPLWIVYGWIHLYFLSTAMISNSKSMKVPAISTE
ncbi:hypothetical protein MLD38_040370 [Melastoma candidum]|uniref:Uncharacterized protein n=1 Tax=Melastoma candidum TaxID=119954 RepID=A0ACB9L648_9MYRT|nr:hypothetical protein MLD38_040370 [Melastoma candidum]